jgi:hypothetical protein
MRHNPALGIMSELLQFRPKPVDRLKIGFLRRNLDEVVRRRIERHVAPDADVGPSCGNDGFDVRQHLGPARQRRSIGIGRNAVALLDMKDGEALEEADAPRRLAGGGRLILLGLGKEGVGIDNHSAFFALANSAAEGERLLEG